MTTNYPPGDVPPSGPSGNLPPRDRDNAAWGCAWWWLIILIILILIIWWAGWGWGPSGGYWFRNRGARPYQQAPNQTVAPAPNTPPGNSGAGTATPPTTNPSGGH